MLTECNRDLFGYEAVEGRQVVAAFDGGQITSDAGALLLGVANRAIGLVGRLAGCFADGRAQERVEHGVETMTSCAMIRCWRPWSASSRRGAGIARRWPARAR